MKVNECVNLFLKTIFTRILVSLKALFRHTQLQLKHVQGTVNYKAQFRHDLGMILFVPWHPRLVILKQQSKFVNFIQFSDKLCCFCIHVTIKKLIFMNI